MKLVLELSLYKDRLNVGGVDYLGREKFPIEFHHVLLYEVFVELILLLKSFIDLLQVVFDSHWHKRLMLGQ